MGKKQKLRIKISKVDRLLLTLAPIISFAVLILVLVSLNRYKDSLVSSTREAIRGLAQNQEKELTEYFDGKLTTLGALTEFPEIYEMDRDRYSDFILERCEDFGFSGIFIVDTKGIAYYPEEKVEKDQSEEEFFAMISAHETYVTNPFYTDDGPIATICHAIYDGSGERVGTLCGKVMLDSIQDLVNRNETIMGGHCFIVNADGYYISSSEEENVDKNLCIYDKKKSSLSLIQEAFEEGCNKNGSITLEGKECYASIRYLSDYDWAIVMCVSSANVERSYRNVVILQHLLALMMLVLCGCVIHMVRCWMRSDREMCTDALCKCGSRVACYKMLEALNSNQKEVIVLYADLNHFKSINDTYGHETGDQALIIFSAILMKVFGKHGFVGRMGGDEFIVLLEGMAMEEAEALWNQAKEEMAGAHDTLPIGITLSSAHGYAVRTRDQAMPIQDLCRLADQEMYRDKLAER